MSYMTLATANTLAHHIYLHIHSPAFIIIIIIIIIITTSLWCDCCLFH